MSKDVIKKDSKIIQVYTLKSMLFILLKAFSLIEQFCLIIGLINNKSD